MSVLPEGVIHASLRNMDADRTPDAELIEFLSPAEIRHSSRFRFQHLTRRYRIGRVLLRTALSELLNCNPGRLCFSQGLQGKPFLLGGPAFNVSHSDGFLLMCFAQEGNLGADIEIIKKMPDMERLMQTFFSPAEVAEIRVLPPHERQAAFFRVWTRKEAFLKALGGGLSIPLDSFCVTAVETWSNALLDTGDCGSNGRCWTIKSVPVEGEIAAAVAWDLPDFTVALTDCRSPLFVGQRGDGFTTTGGGHGSRPSAVSRKNEGAGY